MSNQRQRRGRGFGFNARDQFLVCVAAGLVALAFALIVSPWQAATVIGWDAAAAAWISWTLASIWNKDPDATRQVALAEDDSRVSRDLLLLAAGVASLVGVVLLLLKAATYSATGHTLMTALAGATVALSWATVHLLFALRYADLYYRGDDGIDFHDDRRPDFGDFVYVAFTIGMTYQVSDTDLTSKEVRMTALRHALLSYLFGTAAIAMMINVVAGLLSK